MALQQHIKTPAELRRTLTTLAFGAGVALAAWGASGALAGAGQTETQSSVAREAGNAQSCQTNTVPAGAAPSERPGSRRY